MKMPKTKDAFALRDFNEQYIFSYLYFRHYLGILNEDKSDAEILDFYDARNVVHSGAAKMVKKLADFQKYKVAVDTCKKVFDVRTKQLESLCTKYAQKFTETTAPMWQEKYRCAKNLQQAYNDIISKLLILQKKINELEQDGEKAIDKQRRKEFAERLQDARQKAGLKQSELARKVGVASTTVANYEQGRSDPQIPMLIRLSQVLNISADNLLGLS